METAAHYHTNPIEPSIETLSGWMIDFENPDPAAVNMTDIATALSRINRYNGHSKIPWSVANHSILCLDFAKQFFNVDDFMGLHILLHDAHEAYTGDIVSPLKHMPAIKPHIDAIEQRLQHAIETSFDIGHPAQSERAFIKMIDEHALAIEAHHLVYSKGEHWILRPVFKGALDLFDEPMSMAQTARRFEYRYEAMRSRLEFDRKTGVGVV